MLGKKKLSSHTRISFQELLQRTFNFSILTKNMGMYLFLLRGIYDNLLFNRDEKSFTDVTIACDGQQTKAHKMILSACSPYFKVLYRSLSLNYMFMRTKTVD